MENLKKLKNLQEAKAKEAGKMQKAQEEIKRHWRAEEQQRIQRAQEDQDLLQIAQEEHIRLIKKGKKTPKNAAGGKFAKGRRRKNALGAYF